MALPTLLAGFIFFISQHIICRHLLKAVLFKRLTAADIYFISEKWVNSIQAVMATVVGVIIAQNCGENIMTDVHWLTKSYAWFGLPYFFYDTWAMYKTHHYLNEKRILKMTIKQKLSDFAKKNTAMLLHHISLPLVFFPVILFIRADKGDYFVGIFYTCEAAIPFISLRFVLAQLNMKDNPFYIISGLLMILVFFLI